MHENEHTGSSTSTGEAPPEASKPVDLSIEDAQAAIAEPVPPPATDPITPTAGSGKIKRGTPNARKGGRLAGKRKHETAESSDSDACSVFDRLEVVALDTEVVIDSLLPCDVREKGSDKRRITQFADAFTNNRHVPNIKVVETPDGKRRLADGHHRAQGGLVVGRTTIKADIYRGSRMDCINIALEANRASNPLRPRDIVHAAMLAQETGEKPNISELAIRAGVCRKTVKTYIAQMNDSSLTAGVRGMKAPKSDREIAAELADKVVEAVEIGNDMVVDFVFERLSSDCRAKTLDRLQRRYADTAEA